MTWALSRLAWATPTLAWASIRSAWACSTRACFEAMSASAVRTAGSWDALLARSRRLVLVHRLVEQLLLDGALRLTRPAMRTFCLSRYSRNEVLAMTSAFRCPSIASDAFFSDWALRIFASATLTIAFAWSSAARCWSTALWTSGTYSSARSWSFFTRSPMSTFWTLRNPESLAKSCACSKAWTEQTWTSLRSSPPGVGWVTFDPHPLDGGGIVVAIGDRLRRAVGVGGIRLVAPGK